jgi:hypothetical protein
MNWVLLFDDRSSIRPLTLCGDSVSATCPAGTSGYARRQCLASGVWDTPVTADCVSLQIQAVMANVKTVDPNVTLGALANMTSNSSRLGVVDLLTSVTILKTAAGLVLTSNVSSATLLDSFASVVSNILALPQTVVARASNASTFVPGYCVHTLVVSSWQLSDPLSNADRLFLKDTLSAALSIPQSQISIVNSLVSRGNLSVQYQIDSVDSLSATSLLRNMSDIVNQGSLRTILVSRNPTAFTSSLIGMSSQPEFRNEALASVLDAFVQVSHFLNLAVFSAATSYLRVCRFHYSAVVCWVLESPDGLLLLSDCRLGPRCWRKHHSE